MNKRTKTKRAKPLNAGKSHELSHKPASATKISLSCKGHGIAALAKELADLQALCITLSNAEGSAESARAKSAAENVNTEEHAKCCRAVNDIENVGRRSHGKINALEELILTMEPRTPSETLSLALVLVQEFDVFLGNHTNRTDHAVDLGKQRLEDSAPGHHPWAHLWCRRIEPAHCRVLKPEHPGSMGCSALRRRALGRAVLRGP